MVQAGVDLTDGMGLLRGNSRLTCWEGTEKLIYPKQLLMTDNGLLCQTCQRYSCLTVHITLT